VINVEQKIMNWAEEKALEYYEIPTESRPGSPSTYYNAKKLLTKDSSPKEDALAHFIDLTFDYHFGHKVNTSFSSIHVPTSIYEKSKLSIFQLQLQLISLFPIFDFSRGRTSTVDRLVIKHGQHVHIKLPNESYPFLAILWLFCRFPSTISW